MADGLALMVTAEPSRWSGTYLTLSAEVVRLADGEAEPTNWKSISEYEYDNPYYGLAGLAVTAQADNEEAEPYAMTLRFTDLGSVSLTPEYVAAMAKAGKRIERRMQSMAEKRGYSRDFADYVARFAEAVGTRRYLVRGTLEGLREVSVHGMATFIDKELRAHTAR